MDKNLLQKRISEISNSTSLESIVEHYLNWNSDLEGVLGVAYFKYLAPHKTLILSQSVGLDVKKNIHLGIDLKAEEGEFFSATSLKAPENIPSLNALIQKVFKVENYQFFPLVQGHQVVGVFCFIGVPPDQDPEFKLYWSILNLAVENHLLKKRLYEVNIFDDDIDVLNRQFFVQRMSEEISRSRRLKLPMALLILKVDQSDELFKAKDDYDKKLFMKLLARSVMDNSRKTDVIGRVGEYELSLILPHTSKKGACIKAERLRQIIENLDFSQSIKNLNLVTVSVGVSEYPTLCSDVNELFDSADSALYDIYKSTGNKVCLATASTNHIPDFLYES